MTNLNANKAPRWNLNSIFPSFDSSDYANAKKTLASLAKDLPLHAEKGLDSATWTKEQVLSWLLTALELENKADLYVRTLSSYCYAQYSTNTADSRALNELNSIDELSLPFASASVVFLNTLALHEKTVYSLLDESTELSQYRFYIEDSLFWQKKQMSANEEALAADLARSGSDAWGRLQEQLTSTADCLWDAATGERKTLVELRALAYNPDRSIREKAYHKEQEICKNLSISVAASINGVKGTSISLNKRRGWLGTQGDFPLSPALEKSVAQGRLSPKALKALIISMEESLPYWRSYLKTKAKLLGQDSCAFYDLFAPVGQDFKQYTWQEVEAIVTRCFESFSPRLGAFARRAFSSGWIDGESRSGKISGAYCTDMPLVKETRVLANFDGAFNTVTTIAHELGHAFHSDCVMDLPAILQNYPMTLAETASIFAETIVFNEVLASSNEKEKLALIEVHLQDGCQILVDILSRFYFERSVFAERIQGELSAQDLCAKMLEAQKASYGDGLNPELLHPYMWLVKTHYYSSDLAFYNFPYAFGQLFGMALYARYQKEGPSFAKTYESLLRETGRMDAVTLTAQAGFDIEDPAFWQGGIDLFIAEIAQFEKLVEQYLSKKSF